MSARTAHREHGFVRDARKQRVPAATLSALAASDQPRDSRRQRLVKLVRLKTRETMWKVLSTNALTILVTFYFLGKLEDRLVGRNVLQGLPRTAAILGVLALVGGVAWLTASRAMCARRARLAVEAGFCGSCGYDLAALHPQESDGLIICPECGSAWRRPTAADEPA